MNNNKESNLIPIYSFKTYRLLLDNPRVIIGIYQYQKDGNLYIYEAIKVLEGEYKKLIKCINKENELIYYFDSHIILKFIKEEGTIHIIDISEFIDFSSIYSGKYIEIRDNSDNLDLISTLKK